MKREKSSVAIQVHPGGFDRAIFVTLMRLLRERLRASVTRGSVTPLMHFIYSNFEKSAAQIPTGTVACRKGCSHCCNIWTDAYAPELIFLAKQIRRSHPEQRNLIESVGRFSARQSFEVREKLPISCPLLIDHQCSLYQYRPLNCRTSNSLDAAACEKAFIQCEDVEIPLQAGWDVLAQTYSMALKGALVHAGLAYEPYELYSSLRVCMADPEVERKWLSGYNVFENAQKVSALRPFTHPFWRDLYERAFGA